MDPKTLNRLLVSLLIVPVLLFAVFWIIGIIQRIVLYSIISATGVLIDTWWIVPVRCGLTSLAALWLIFFALVFIRTGEFRLPRIVKK